MKDFKNLEDYEKYLIKFSCEEVFKIAEGIDQQAYPDRYKLAIKIAMDKSLNNTKHNVIRCMFPPGVNFIKNIELLFAILSPLYIMYLVVGKSIANYFVLINVVFWAITSYLIYYGIKYKKDWAVMLVLVTASFGLINMLLYILGSKNENVYAVHDLISSVFTAVYFVYQIYVFSRSDTKIFFKAKEYEII